MFLGAAGSFNHDQRQIDVEFVPQPFHDGRRYRLVHVCIGLGVAFLYVEVLHPFLGWVRAQAQLMIELYDRGHTAHHLLPPPGNLANPVAVGGPHNLGFLLIFGHRLLVKHTPPVPPGPIFRYIPHRRPTPAEEMVPIEGRRVLCFRELEYGGQVQNWRKAIGYHFECELVPSSCRPTH